MENLAKNLKLNKRRSESRSKMAMKSLRSRNYSILDALIFDLEITPCVVRSKMLHYYCVVFFTANFTSIMRKQEIVRQFLKTI